MVPVLPAATRDSAMTGYRPSWYAETMASAPERGPLAADLDVDVCVVGAGLAGLTVARELARRGWSVAVLERHKVAWNASGLNSGFVLPGFSKDMESVVKRVGPVGAKALWALSEVGLEYVRTTIRETEMPGVELVEEGWLDVSKTDDAEQHIAMVRLIGQEFGSRVEGWPVERVREVLRSDSYFHAVHLPQAFHIHPLNYALGLAAAAEQAGARIYEQTTALSIDASGVRKHVETTSGRLRAGHVVLAGNVHLGKLLPRISGTLVGLWNYVMVTQPIGERLADTVRFRGAISDSDVADNHYRIVGGDRLLWSGRLTAWQGNPRHYIRTLKNDIANVYPRLRGVEFEFSWTCVDGSALHRMPQIGEFAPRMWLAAGFGGHGINTTAMAGNIIAKAITDGDDTWRRFVPFELVWAGGLIGRAAAQASYWWYHFQERRRAREARKRQEEYRRAERAMTMERPRDEASPAAPDVTATPATATTATPIRAVGEPASRYDWRGLLEPRRRLTPRQD
jgi:gamma-glutamylputrescine oxidase